MSGRILALAGGVGGAKLALGLANVLPPDALTVAVNTADDFEHLGFSISPDLDTVMYTLAGVANPETGWGRRGESWTVMEALGAVGGETWFRLGDKDLATHIERTRRLRARREPVVGHARSRGTPRREARDGADVRRSGAHHGRPPTRASSPSRTGSCACSCEPVVQAPSASPAPSMARPHSALTRSRRPARHRRLPVQSLRQRRADPGACPACGRRSSKAKAPRVAVTPIVGGQAIKGPAAKMLAELGHDVSALGVARYYKDWVDGFVLDAQDAALAARHRRTGHAGAGRRHHDAKRRRQAAPCRRGARFRGRTRGLWATLLTPCSPPSFR